MSTRIKKRAEKKPPISDAVALMYFEQLEETLVEMHSEPFTLATDRHTEAEWMSPEVVTPLGK